MNSYRTHAAKIGEAGHAAPFGCAPMGQAAWDGVAAFGRYVAMKRRTLASVSGQRRRGLSRFPPRISSISRQSPSASRPNVLSAIPCVAMNASISDRSVLCMMG